MTSLFTHSDPDGDSLGIETPGSHAPAGSALFAVTSYGGAWLSQDAVDRLAEVLDGYRSKPEPVLAEWEVALLGEAAETDVPKAPTFEAGDRVYVGEHECWLGKECPAFDTFATVAETVDDEFVYIDTDGGGRYIIHSGYLESLDETPLFEAGDRVRVSTSFYAGGAATKGLGTVRAPAHVGGNRGDFAVRLDDGQVLGYFTHELTPVTESLKEGDRVLVSWHVGDAALYWSGPATVTDPGEYGATVVTDHNGERGYFGLGDLTKVDRDWPAEGDRVLWAPRHPGHYSATPGATATIVGFSSEFGSVRVEWDRSNGLAGGQRDGGYSPLDFRRVG